MPASGGEGRGEGGAAPATPTSIQTQPAAAVQSAPPLTATQSALATATLPLPTGDSLVFAPTGAANQFSAEGLSFQASIASSGVTFTLPASAGAGPSVIGMNFVGGNANAEAVGVLPTPSMQGTGAFGETVLQNVWPGVSVSFTGTSTNVLEDTFVVAANADPSVIATSYSGVNSLAVNDNGDLVLSLPNGQSFLQTKPTLFQEVNGQQVPVDGSYLLQSANNVAGFSIGSTYNPNLPLYIDPAYPTGIGNQYYTVGDSVSLNASDSNLSGSVVYALTGGALPSGLGLNSSTGLISGVINSGTVAGSPYNVQVEASGSTVEWDSFSIYVNPATLTVTANDSSMTYGGSIPTLTASYSGFVNSDTSASLTTLPTITTTATSSSPVTGSYTTNASGAADPDYTFNYVAGTMTINPAPLSITADDNSMTYGGSVPTLTASYSGFVNGDTSLSSPPSITTTADSSSTVDGSPYTISASGGSDSNYAITGYTSGAMTVYPAPLTVSVTADDKVYDGSTTATVAGFSASPLLNGDTVTYTNTSADFDTADVGTGKTVTVLGISIGGAAADNYSLTSSSATTTADITQASSTTTLSSSKNSSVLNVDDVVFTAHVANSVGGRVPTGNVEFYDGLTDLGPGTLDGSGNATFDAGTGLVLGPHAMSAVYAGDSNFYGSSGGMTQTVVRGTTPSPMTTAVCGCDCPTDVDQLAGDPAPVTNAPDQETVAPIRYADGTVHLVAYDLSFWSTVLGTWTGAKRAAGRTALAMPRVRTMATAGSIHRRRAFCKLAAHRRWPSRVPDQILIAFVAKLALYEF